MEKTIDVKKVYDDLSKKHKLPRFNELDKEIRLNELEKTREEYLLYYIRLRLGEKLSFFANILDSCIHPLSQTFVVMHESKSFKEDDKKSMMEMLGKTMGLLRENILLYTTTTEKEDADYINRVMKEIPSIKKEVDRVAKILKESWSKEEESDTENYFG
ncbi:MAG: hypothetical protein PHT54_05070 [Candidatus Nanoarchaeia archaeon]|nr:hypothetical protein [Candidatus Nanoarchaeia archaeon]